MADKREKSLSYRRCVWLNNDPSTISLSQCIKQATDKLRTLDDRTIGRSGQLIKLLSLKPKSGGFLMHISIETPGESASIVPKIHPVPDEVNVGTASPPPNSEFMDGDAFLYIREDNVCLCSTIIRDGAIAYYLRQLFDKAKIRKDSTQFDLQKVADMDKVQLLSKLGVKEIEIKASLFEASAMYQKRKNQTVGILAAAARHAKFVFGNEHDVNEDALNVVLAIRVDGRRKGLKLGEKRIKDLAVDLLKHQEHVDEFTIITKNGQRIGPEEIYIKTTVEIESVGKSVDRDATWKELLNFYKTLESIGALEE